MTTNHTELFDQLNRVIETIVPVDHRYGNGPLVPPSDWEEVHFDTLCCEVEEFVSSYIDRTGGTSQHFYKVLLQVAQVNLEAFEDELLNQP